ncbi:MAG TPA: ABC transporter ATP-binding protein, partial [Firmicutes bacterium]|nr:ABC transporter ATP-binding protein [Bacillota bacterium]
MKNITNTVHSSASAIIAVSNLSKLYDKHRVVDNLSFTIQSGQTLGLLGPNGAGKSTTMRILMGLSRPSAGKATILGFDLQKETKKIHNQIGVVFEKPNLFENLSGYQNLAIFCRLYNQPLTNIQPLLERMNLWERAHDPLKEYSKGMKQRILILRALIHSPKILFLDEPCSG